MTVIVPEKEEVELINASKNILAKFKIEGLTSGAIHEIIIDDRTGRVLSGSHRKKSDPAWPENHIRTKNELEAQLIILHSNFQRQVSSEETCVHLLKIAECLEAEQGIPKHRIAQTLLEYLPMSQRRIQELLPREYKEKPRTPPGTNAQKMNQEEREALQKIEEKLKELTGKSVQPSDDMTDALCPKTVYRTVLIHQKNASARAVNMRIIAL